MSRKLTAIEQLDQVGDTITRSLNTLVGLETDRAAASAAAAGSAADLALAIGIAAAVLAVLTGAGFAWFMIGLLRRAHQRELELTEALGRLGDRDELLARLRSASAVLGEVAAATQQIREAAEQLAAEQAQWAATSERLGRLVDEIENALREDSRELIHEHLHTGRRGAAPWRRAGNMLKATWG